MIAIFFQSSFHKNFSFLFFIFNFSSHFVTCSASLSTSSRRLLSFGKPLSSLNTKQLAIHLSSHFERKKRTQQPTFSIEF